MLPILLYQHCSSCCLQLGVFREQAPNRQLRVFNQNGALIQTFDLGKAQEGHQLWDTRRVIPEYMCMTCTKETVKCMPVRL